MSLTPDQEPLRRAIIYELATAQLGLIVSALRAVGFTVSTDTITVSFFFKEDACKQDLTIVDDVMSELDSQGAAPDGWAMEQAVHRTDARPVPLSQLDGVTYLRKEDE